MSDLLKLVSEKSDIARILNQLPFKPEEEPNDSARPNGAVTIDGLFEEYYIPIDDNQNSTIRVNDYLGKFKIERMGKTKFKVSFLGICGPPDLIFEAESIVPSIPWMSFVSYGGTKEAYVMAYGKSSLYSQNYPHIKEFRIYASLKSVQPIVSTQQTSQSLHSAAAHP